jgi:hypothetical protein
MFSPKIGKNCRTSCGVAHTTVSVTREKQNFEAENYWLKPPSAFEIHTCTYIRMYVTKINPGLPDFSWYMIPKPELNVPNEQKMYQMVIRYPKCPLNIPNGHNVHISIFSILTLSKIYQNWKIFGLKKQTIWKPWINLITK